MRRTLPLLFVCWLVGTAFADFQVNTVTVHSQTLPAIAMSGGRYFVVYQDDSTFQSDVYLAVADEELVFTETVLPYESDQTDQEAPDVAVGPDGAVYVVWADFHSGADYDIYLGISTDNGLTFGEPRQVNAESSGTQVEPTIAVDDAGLVYVAWADNYRTTARDYGVRWDIRLAVSEDDGVSFSEPERMNPLDDVFAVYPELAATPDGAVLTWFDFDNRIGARVTVDGGATWEEAVWLNGYGRADFPKVAADDAGNLAVVWNDATEDANGKDPNLVHNGSGRCYDVYIAVSGDAGLSWSTATRVNEELLLNQQYPTVSFLGEKMVVAWSDDRTVGDYTITGVIATPPWSWPLAGEQWDDYPEPTLRDRPDLAGDVLVWQDYRNGDWDIYAVRVEE